MRELPIVVHESMIHPKSLSSLKIRYETRVRTLGDGRFLSGLNTNGQSHILQTKSAEKNKPYTAATLAPRPANGAY
jgi:hypothetical protein